jgi:hypothetical protein
MIRQSLAHQLRPPLFPMAKTNPNSRNGSACPLLPAGWDVPPEFRERLGDEVGRQRLIHADGQLLLVLHSPPKAGEDHRTGRLFWRDREGRWKPTGLTHNEHAIGELLREYETLANEIDTLEDGANVAADYFEILTEVGPLIRSANNLLGVLEEARMIARKDRALLIVRDRAYTLTRRLDLMQHEANVNLDFVTAKRAEEQAEAIHHQSQAMYRLNLLAAFFVPLATFSAVFGMNLSNGLEGLDATMGPAPLYMLVAFGLGLGGVLALIVGRR